MKWILRWFSTLSLQQEIRRRNNKYRFIARDDPEYYSQLLAAQQKTAQLLRSESGRKAAFTPEEEYAEYRQPLSLDTPTELPNGGIEVDSLSDLTINDFVISEDSLPYIVRGDTLCCVDPGDDSPLKLGYRYHCFGASYKNKVCRAVQVIEYPGLFFRPESFEVLREES